MLITTKNVLVSDFMVPLGKFAVVNSHETVKASLDVMNSTGLGSVCVIDKNSRLLGVFTDGDLRRLLIKVQKPMASLLVDDLIDYATKTPIVCSPRDSIRDVVSLMEEKKIWDLPVLENSYLVGLVHLHEVIKRLLDHD